VRRRGIHDIGVEDRNPVRLLDDEFIENVSVVIIIVIEGPCAAAIWTLTFVVSVFIDKSSRSRHVFVFMSDSR